MIKERRLKIKYIKFGDKKLSLVDTDINYLITIEDHPDHSDCFINTAKQPSEKKDMSVLNSKTKDILTTLLHRFAKEKECILDLDLIIELIKEVKNETTKNKS